MSRPLWFVDILKKNFKNRFQIADLTRKSNFFRKLIDSLLFEGDDIIYLPKDSVVKSNGNGHHPIKIDIHEPIQPEENLVLPTQVVKHFINQANYLWIMNSCICRDSNQCEHYPIELGCIFLGKAVEGINPQLGRRVTREEALQHLQRCREAGLVQMVGRNKIDTVWMGVQPGDHLLTICNCCSCCCLYRVLPNLHTTISKKISRMPGVEVYVTDSCVVCGACTQGVCFANAIHLENGRAVISDDCRGCGLCVEVCPEHAIKLEVNAQDSLQKTIERLNRIVDVT